MRSETTAKWAELVEAYETSGLSVEAFAEKHGVVARTLTWWRWKLRQTPQPRQAPMPAFVELTMAAPAPKAELVLRLERIGVEVTVQNGFDPKLLRAVVEALC